MMPHIMNRGDRREPILMDDADSIKGSVLDNDNYISQIQSPDIAGKLRVENDAAHHESW
jgi:hypothetical protein